MLLYPTNTGESTGRNEARVPVQTQVHCTCCIQNINSQNTFNYILTGGKAEGSSISVTLLLFTTALFVNHRVISSVAQSCPTLCTHGLQHAKPPCPSPTPGFYLNSCPLSWWRHPTTIRVFSNESVLCIRWPKYGSFSFNSSPSNACSGLISVRMGWLDPLG